LESIIPPQIAQSQPLNFTEEKDYERGFATYFDEKIKPTLRELESFRAQKLEESKKKKPLANLILAGGIILGILVGYVTKKGEVGIALAIMAFFIRTLIISAPQAKYISEYKNKIIPAILKFFGDFSYKENDDVPVDLLIQSKLFDDFNRSYSEDVISGKYREKQFQFSEISLTKKINRKHSNTVFMGKLFILETDRTITGKIIIKRDAQKGLWNWLASREHGLKKVIVQNQEFEKGFEVYSNDQNEAMTVIIPKLMQKLMILSEKYMASGIIRCSFLENKMIMAISTPNNWTIKDSGLFEVTSVEGSMLTDIHKFLAQFHEILEILDIISPA
jgi:hypothetical protein